MNIIQHFIYFMAGVGMAFTVLHASKFLKDRFRPKPQPAPANPMGISENYNFPQGLLLNIHGHRVMVPHALPLHRAVEQVTSFCNAVLQGYERQDTEEGYRQAALIRDFIATIPQKIAQMRETQQQTILNN